MITDTDIAEALASLDFQRIHRVMEFLNWRWIGDNTMSVPTVDKIRSHAERMLSEFLNSPAIEYRSCCGFTLRRDARGMVEICFELESGFLETNKE